MLWRTVSQWGRLVAGCGRHGLKQASQFLLSIFISFQRVDVKLDGCSYHFPSPLSVEQLVCLQWYRTGVSTNPPSRMCSCKKMTDTRKSCPKAVVSNIFGLLFRCIQWCVVVDQSEPPSGKRDALKVNKLRDGNGSLAGQPRAAGIPVLLPMAWPVPVATRFDSDKLEHSTSRKIAGRQGSGPQSSGASAKQN